MDKPKLSYLDIMKDWQGFLGAHSQNFMRIKDLSSNKWLRYDKKQKESYLKHEDIFAKHPDLASFLDEIIKREGIKRIYVEFKKENGNSGSFLHPDRKPIPVDVSFRLRQLKNGVASEIKVMEEPKPTPQQNTAMPVIAPTPNVPTYNPNDFEAQVMMHRGGLGAAGLAAGMGMRQLLDVEKRAEMSDHFKTEMEFYKKKFDELDIENRKLNSEISIAEKQKEIAVTEAKLAAKSWSDPDNIKAILENAGPVVQGILAAKAGAPQQIGMGAANLSEIKQRFVEFVSANDFPDEKVQVLEHTLINLIQKEDFQEKLIELINQKNEENAQAV